MSRLAVTRIVFSLTAIVALLPACGSLSSIGVGSQPISNGSPLDASSSYTVLHSFLSAPCDGFWPADSLIAVNGVLYGTTLAGGGWNVGTIFSITPSGVEQTLYNFPKKSQNGGQYGYEPKASLLEAGGKLFGTTQYGGTPGKHGYGSVFGYKITSTTNDRNVRGNLRHHCMSAGSIHVIHRFTGGSDGANPVAGLLSVHGAFYGTTPAGGTFGEGTVFRIVPPHTERVLYSFGGSSNDAKMPLAGLIDVNGTLYGTTYRGGSYGDGTVFSITTSGSEHVLHQFGNGSDGMQPEASLVDVNGTLYGTTFDGGTNGDGTIFSMTPSGTESVLHSFDDLDGKYPSSPLIDVNGKLYGTTQLGGYFSCYSNHCGTVFSVTTNGKEIVLHSFRGSLYSDGEYPDGGLVALNGILYGTTYAGGADGEGTVFSLKP